MDVESVRNFNAAAVHDDLLTSAREAPVRVGRQLRRELPTCLLDRTRLGVAQGLRWKRSLLTPESTAKIRVSFAAVAQIVVQVKTVCACFWSRKSRRRD